MFIYLVFELVLSGKNISFYYQCRAKKIIINHKHYIIGTFFQVEGLAKHLRCVGIDAAVPNSKKPDSRYYPLKVFLLLLPFKTTSGSWRSIILCTFIKM